MSGKVRAWVLWCGGSGGEYKQVMPEKMESKCGADKLWGKGLESDHKVDMCNLERQRSKARV